MTSEGGTREGSEKGLIVRSIPLIRFASLLDVINEAFPIEGYDLLIQDSVAGQLENRFKLNYLAVKPGKLGLFSGFCHASFFRYARVILPLSSTEPGDYINLLLFALPVVSREYVLVRPDDSVVIMGGARLWFGIAAHYLLEAVTTLILLALAPFLLAVIFANRLRRRRPAAR